jgi:hypothetical protein
VNIQDELRRSGRSARCWRQYSSSMIAWPRRLYLLMTWTFLLPMAYCHINRRTSIGNPDSNGLSCWLVRGPMHTSRCEAAIEGGSASTQYVSTNYVGEHRHAQVAAYLDGLVFDVTVSTQGVSLHRISSGFGGYTSKD